MASAASIDETSRATIRRSRGANRMARRPYIA
jgi:hypothetical protein